MRFLLERLRALRLPPLGRNAQIGIAIGGLLIVLVAGVIYFLPQTEEVIDERADTGNAAELSFTDSYVDGTHEIEGTVTLRNRCQRFEASGMLDESVSPPLVRIDITNEDDEGICLEIPETHEFKVSVPGPESAGVEVFVNGIPSSGTAL